MSDCSSPNSIRERIANAFYLLNRVYGPPDAEAVVSIKFRLSTIKIILIYNNFNFNSSSNSTHLFNCIITSQGGVNGVGGGSGQALANE